MTDKKLEEAAMLEKLAALEHEQWILWSKDIAATETITPARLHRWRIMWGPYDELSAEEKDKDREWAMKVLEIIAGAEWREEQDNQIYGTAAAGGKRCSELDREAEELIKQHDEALLREGYQGGFIKGMDFADAMEAGELHPDCEPNIDGCFDDFLKSRGGR